MTMDDEQIELLIGHTCSTVNAGRGGGVNHIGQLLDAIKAQRAELDRLRADIPDEAAHDCADHARRLAEESARLRADLDSYMRIANDEAHEAECLRAKVAKAEAAAAKVPGIWFQFNSEGEPTGGYCTVESYDPGDMVLYVRKDAILTAYREAGQ